jgi:L-amino acid N-acyltransferase YncA
MTQIRKAQESDFEDIWNIFHQVVQTGTTYTFAPDTTPDQAHSLWMEGDLNTYVALFDDEIVGTYILRPNHRGLGSHVANAAYMVKPSAQGKGVGKAMCEHSLEEARRAGFQAMQFNLVVSTNESAIALWKKMGFAIVGTLPKVFGHRELGLVDAYVMYRFLD